METSFREGNPACLHLRSKEGPENFSVQDRRIEKRRRDVKIGNFGQLHLDERTIFGRNAPPVFGLRVSLVVKYDDGTPLGLNVRRPCRAFVGGDSGTPNLQIPYTRRLATVQPRWRPLRGRVYGHCLTFYLMSLVQLMMHSPGTSSQGKVLLTGERPCVFDPRDSAQGV